MAIATLQGHTQRAIDFYNKAGKYFIIGGTSEDTPEQPSDTDFKLHGVIGYKRVDETSLVTKVTDKEIELYGYENTIDYRSEKWRRVLPPFTTTVGTEGIPGNSHVVHLSSLAGMSVGSKIRVANLYEGIITERNEKDNKVTITTPAPSYIPAGSKVEAGALVEGAKYVYVMCYLNYNEFPLGTYRQIGLCTEVTPNQDILKAAGHGGATADEFTSPGVLEVLDNRAPSVRDIDQREMLSLVLEY